MQGDGVHEGMWRAWGLSFDEFLDFPRIVPCWDVLENDFLFLIGL